MPDRVEASFEMRLSGGHAEGLGAVEALRYNESVH